VVELPRDAQKPDPRGLRRILKDYRLSPAQVLYVGDSVKKDMALAAEVGATGAWAEYGTYVSTEYRERLAVISAKRVTQRHVPDEGEQRWPLALSSFAQVLGLVEAAAAARRPVRVARRRAAG